MANKQLVTTIHAKLLLTEDANFTFILKLCVILFTMIGHGVNLAAYTVTTGKGEQGCSQDFGVCVGGVGFLHVR